MSELTIDRNLERLMTYIWVRDVSKKIFDVDLDPEISEEEIARMFNKMNIANCQNFTYIEITKIVENRLGKSRNV